MRAKLTKRAVERIRPEPKRDVVVWDQELRGFGVRVKPSGARSYLVQYRNAYGRSKRLTIGQHGVLAPDQARRQAKKVLGEVARGDDPAAARAEARKALTIADLAERYLEEHARPKKKPSSVRMDEANLRLHVLPALGTRQIIEVTRADVARLHHEMRATPGAANRVVALLSKMFTLAELWGLRPDATNPCRHVERYREQRLERFLSDGELASLGTALAQAETAGAESDFVIAAIRLLILTGCRTGEILSLRWDDVNFEHQTLKLPESKTGAKTIQLSAPALKVLDALPREGSPWVIRGLAGHHLVNLRKPWHRLRRNVALEDVRLHDLRHSFASVGAGAGLGLPVIGKLLGHTQPATTQRYAHLADDPLRQATDLIGRRIAAAMEGKPDAEVIPLRRQGS